LIAKRFHAVPMAAACAAGARLRFRAAAIHSALNSAYMNGNCGRNPRICVNRSSNAIAAFAPPALSIPFAKHANCATHVAQIALHSLRTGACAATRARASGMRITLFPSLKGAVNAISKIFVPCACAVIARQPFNYAGVSASQIRCSNRVTGRERLRLKTPARSSASYFA